MLRSVGVRLLFLVALPMVGLVALAAIQTRASLATVADADRGLVMADAATATTGLVQQLERELAETSALQERKGTAGASLVLAQRSRTDVALQRYQQARGAALRSVSALAGSYATADAKLARLGDIRAAAPPSTTGAGASTEWDKNYRDLNAAVVEVGQALPGQLTDPGLAAQARAIVELTAATHAFAQQRDLLRTVLTRSPKMFAATDQAALAGLAGAEKERRNEFIRAADQAAQNDFRTLVAGSDVENAQRIRDSALIGDQALLLTDADGWYVASTHAVRVMNEVQLTLADRLHRSAVAQRTAAVRSAAIALGGSAAVALATVTITVTVATRISRRLRRLRNAALAVAGEQLPAAIDALTHADDPIAIANAQMADARSAGKLTDGPSDEIKQVGHAFAIMQRQALQLAAAQALLRRDMGAIFVALARRNQTLVLRQLEVIDDLERHETDPDTLEQYYKVDHLAARMRRNSENLLVLAGSDPGRSFSTAQSLLDVVRAAASEITDYARIDPIDLVYAPIAGHAVGDLVHLLAELLENAATYSPPESRVRVTALHTANELLLTIYDDGIGMSPAELADANHRLAARVDLTASLAGSMGLLVVARLAFRHEIEVQLRSHPGAGTVALVHVPNELLVTGDDGRSGVGGPRQPATSGLRAIGSVPARKQGVPRPGSAPSRPDPAVPIPVPALPKPVPAAQRHRQAAPVAGPAPVAGQAARAPGQAAGSRQAVRIPGQALAGAGPAPSPRRPAQAPGRAAPGAGSALPRPRQPVRVPGQASPGAGPAQQSPGVEASIFEELSSGWFRPLDREAEEPEPGWTSAGDQERGVVDQVFAEPTHVASTAAGLPSRRPGTRLVPGSVATPEARPVRIDPERVRARLGGLGRAVRATERDDATRDNRHGTGPGR